MSVRAGILSVTGYAGGELARLLLQHPEVELVAVTGRSAVGQKLSSVLPHLGINSADLTITERIDEDVDVVFSALPHGTSAEQLLSYYERGKVCIDLSADFRLDSADEYAKWYGAKHIKPELLTTATYGLTELNRSEILRSDLIACPGCFPTSVLLGVAPLVSDGLVAPQVLADSKTGISGAGRTNKSAYGFSELTESVRAYGTAGHRHSPEMTQEVNKLSSDEVQLNFVPHLVPMARGILSTCYMTLREDISAAKLGAVYREYYADMPFVKICTEPPSTKLVSGSNFTLIYPFLAEGGVVVVLSVIDNLIKGAAGQAVQNMNVRFGFAETAGLQQLSIHP